MDKEHIVGILRQHEPELRASGLLHLRLFGSIARGDSTAGSDVDLLFDYDESVAWNLFRAYGYQDRLTEILGVPAHLCTAKHLRDHVRAAALKETVLVF